jgi:biopolymer transport protein ExbD
MKFRRHVEFEHGLKQIDIAPLIDIIFLLLIFFLLTSNFILQPGIPVKLTKAVTSQALRRENLVLNLTFEGRVYCNAEEIKLPQELKDLLARAVRENTPVLIKADQRASLGKVVEIWDMARQTGVTVINIATDRQ